MSEKFQLLPAVDVSNGQTVRLSQGFIDSGSQFTSPQEIVNQFKNSGTTWIHLVDLNQAFGDGNNQQLLTEIVRANPEINFQVSGGVANETTLRSALGMGAKRVNISCAALGNKDWLEQAFFEQGSSVYFGLDVKDGDVCPRGTKLNFGPLDETLDFLSETQCSGLVVTDSERDGMLSGPNMVLLERVASTLGKPVIASGGIASLADLEMLVESGFVSGAILGKALYVGNFTLAQAQSVIGS